MFKKERSITCLDDDRREITLAVMAEVYQICRTCEVSNDAASSMLKINTDRYVRGPEVQSCRNTRMMWCKDVTKQCMQW